MAMLAPRNMYALSKSGLDCLQRGLLRTGKRLTEVPCRPVCDLDYGCKPIILKWKCKLPERYPRVCPPIPRCPEKCPSPKPKCPCVTYPHRRWCCPPCFPNSYRLPPCPKPISEYPPIPAPAAYCCPPNNVRIRISTRPICPPPACGFRPM